LNPLKLQLPYEAEMSQQSEELAQRVVATFRARLSDAALEQLSETDFNELALMVREAISEELVRATDLVEEVVHKLRFETDRPDISL
jgi:hypothetical protein